MNQRFDNEGLTKTNKMKFEFTRIDTELYKYQRSCVFVSEVIPAISTSYLGKFFIA